MVRGTSIALAIQHFLESHKIPGFAVFSIVFLTGIAGDAFGRPFWFDELCSWHIARLPSLAAIVAAINQGVEPNPPLSYVLIRFSHLLFGTGELATRLPSVAAFWVALLFLFLVVSRRCGAVLGYVAIIFVSMTKPVAFASEARPYALILACCSASFFFWQSAVERRPRWALPGLCLSLALGLFSHLYAVLLFVPLAAGEAYRSVVTRNVDRRVWIAMGLAALAILPSVPTVLKFSAFSRSFWSQPTADTLLAATDVFFRNPLVVALLGTACVMGFSERRQTVVRLPAHEVVAVAVLLSLPLLGFVVAKFVTNAFWFRYFLPAAVGMGIALAFVYRRLLAGRPAALCLLLAALTGLFLAAQGWRTRQFLVDAPSVTESVRIGGKFGVEGQAPIVINHYHAFLEYLYYAPADSRSRFRYVVDLDAASRLANEDTSDRALAGLRSVTSLPVEDYRSFVSSHPHFWVYGTGGWLLRKLQNDGARLTIEYRGGVPFVEVYMQRQQPGCDPARRGGE